MRVRELTIPKKNHFLKSDKKQGFGDGNSKKELKNANILRSKTTIPSRG